MNKARRELLEKIMATMGELHRSFATTREKSIASLNLTQPQMELLYLLKHGKKTTAEVATQFRISSSAVSQRVDQLVLKNLVERIQGQDRRSSFVQLSEHGTKTFVGIRHQFIDALNERFSGIDDRELEQLLSVITKAASHIKNGV